MGQSTKSVLWLLAIISGFVTLGAWTDDAPGAGAWGMRIVGPVALVLLFGLLLKLDLRKDLAPDHLLGITGDYFNRDGFCFAVTVIVSDGVAWMVAHFQSQHDSECLGQIALRPAREFFLNRAELDVVAFEIECPPAAFGCASVPLPIPQHLQGKRQTFEVGASVRYPFGKGRRVRFRDGIFLRRNSEFGDLFGKTLAVTGALTGRLVLSRPAIVTIDLPVEVAEMIPNHHAPEIEILWQPESNVGQVEA